MALSDLLNEVEKKVAEVQDLKIKADSASLASDVASKKLNSAQGELETLRTKVHEALGNVFNENPRVRATK